MRQSNVIKGDGHTIEAYRFKVLSTFPEQNEEKKQESAPELDELKELNLEEKKPELEQPKLEPSFIEELLKRTEELSDNIIKLQMKIESQESEFQKRLEDEVKKTKETAFAEGQSVAKAEFDEKLKEIEAKFVASIQKIDDEKLNLEEFYKKSEEELPNTAIQIAKEIVLKEISQHSSKIAFSIAKSLLGELKNATNLEVKVSPQNFGYVSENLKVSSEIKITADDAVSPGGVIVLSDVGNIDGNILTRFEKIKKILSE